MKFYQYPKCSTCVKASKFLQANELQHEKIDITQTPPSVDELNAMLAHYDGNIRKLFNTSGMQYRELKLKDTLPTMSQEEAIQLLSENGMLVKRPFLLGGDAALLGFKEAEWTNALL